MKGPGALAMMLALAPGVALAASYASVAIDKKTLAITDLRSPHQIGSEAQTYEVVLNRVPTKGKHGLVEYVINRIDFDCTGSKVRRVYSASYSASGALVDSDPIQKPWGKITPDTAEERLKFLGCNGLAPRTGFVLGDVRVGKIIASYRAGAYDRFIH